MVATRRSANGRPTARTLGPRCMTEADFLHHHCAPRYPHVEAFVWCRAMGVDVDPFTDPGEVVTAHGQPLLVVEWTRNFRGERLRARTGAWLPADLVPSETRAGRFCRHDPQPSLERRL